MKKFIIILYIMFLIFIMNLYSETNAESRNVKKVVKEISPSIVKVIALDGRKYIASGIVIEKNLIVSNAKVAAHPFKKIIIKTHKGESYNADIVGSDNRTSIILLRIKGEKLKPARTGKKPDAGDWAGLVGVFYRTFPYIKDGIVSSSDDNRLILNSTVMPGTTGGAVVNRRGELVGMIRGMLGFQYFPQYIFKDNSSELKIIPENKMKGSQCLALPIKKVRQVVSELKNHGYVRRGWLGVNISGGYNGIVRIDRVERKSAAEKGGLKRGDIIVEMDGKSIRSASEIASLISGKFPGEKVKLKLQRGKNRINLSVKLGDFRKRKVTSDPGSFFTMKSSLPVIPELLESLPVFKRYVYRVTGPVTLGLNTVALTPELADEFEVPGNGGLLISKIMESRIGKAGLKVGDILVRAGGKRLASTDELKKVVISSKPDTVLDLEFYRKGKKKNIRISPDSLAGSKNPIGNFRKKMAEMKYWMELNEKMKIKRQLENLKLLEARKLREVLEKKNIQREKSEIEREKEMLRKEYLKRIKEELEKLRLEKIKIEKKLKEKKSKKKKKEGYPFL